MEIENFIFLGVATIFFCKLYNTIDKIFGVRITSASLYDIPIPIRNNHHRLHSRCSSYEGKDRDYIKKTIFQDFVHKVRRSIMQNTQVILTKCL